MLVGPQKGALDMGILASKRDNRRLQIVPPLNLSARGGADSTTARRPEGAGAGPPSKAAASPAQAAPSPVAAQLSRSTPRDGGNPGGASAEQLSAEAAGQSRTQGRFKVYEEPQLLPSADAGCPTGDAPTEGRQQQQQQPQCGGTNPAEMTFAEEAGGEAGRTKRKGRFTYVEDDCGMRAPGGASPGVPSPARGGGSSSVAGGNDAATPLRSRASSAARSLADKPPIGRACPAGQPAHVLLPSLKQLLEGLTLQQELVLEMVAAVSDAKRGRGGHLAALLREHKLASPQTPRDEVEALCAAVKELKEENAWLRGRLCTYESGAGFGPRSLGL